MLAESLRAHVVGQSFVDGDAIAALRAAVPHEDWVGSVALSAIDMALWDLLARSRQMPLWQALDGTSGIVDVYASGGLYRDGADDNDLAREVARYRSEGFRDVKIKVGGMPPDDDVARIAAARAAIERDGALWVDAVNHFNADNAIEHAHAFRNAGADAIQAPVAFDDHATMSRIGRECLPVIAGEAGFCVGALERLLDEAKVAFLQVNLGLCGGFSGADQIAALAASRGTPVTVQAHGTAVLLEASLHWGAARNVHSVEFHRFHDHLQASFKPAFDDLCDGTIRLDHRPAATNSLRAGVVPGEGAALGSVWSLPDRVEGPGFEG